MIVKTNFLAFRRLRFLTRKKLINGKISKTLGFMNINRELNGLNKRITRLKFKENPPILQMVTLQPWEVEDEADVNDEYCLMVRIEDKDPNLFPNSK